MFRLAFALTALVIAPAAVHAQAQDAALAAYVGAWHVAIPGTPSGTVTGTLTVAADGTGTLTLTEMQVQDSPLTGVHVQGDRLVAETSFFSPVSGQTHTGTISLAPTNDGLAGTIGADGSGFEVTARRAGPSEASALTPYFGTWEIAVAGTPIGVVHGTLQVAEDELSTLTLTEMQVDFTLLTNVRAGAEGLTANTSFFSPVSGATHSVSIRLAQQSDGSLSGDMSDGPTPYGMTAQRPAP